MHILVYQIELMLGVLVLLPTLMGNTLCSFFSIHIGNIIFSPPAISLFSFRKRTSNPCESASILALTSRLLSPILDIKEHD